MEFRVDIILKYLLIVLESLCVRNVYKVGGNVLIQGLVVTEYEVCLR